jgi:hypothetical protein
MASYLLLKIDNLLITAVEIARQQAHNIEVGNSALFDTAHYST